MRAPPRESLPAARDHRGMGLTVIVGIVEEVGADEEERHDNLALFERRNAALRDAGVEPHDEPEAVPDGFEADVGGYMPLHFLRAAAARLWSTGFLRPPPRGDDPAKDPLLSSYFDASVSTAVERHRHTWLGTPDRGHGTFDHLILHSDAEGCNLSVAMDRPLEADVGDGYEIIGSVSGWLSECRRLAREIPVPSDVLRDPERAFAGWQEPGLWGGLGVQVHALAILMAACRVSNRTGAALVLA